MWVGTVEKVFKVRGQRSRSWEDQLTLTAEAYISTVRRRGSSVNNNNNNNTSVLLLCSCHPGGGGRVVREWQLLFPFPPIPVESFPFPFFPTSLFCHKWCSLFIYHYNVAMQKQDFFTCAIPMALFPLPLVAQKLCPFLWDFHGNPIPMGIPIPMHTSNRGGAWALEQSVCLSVCLSCAENHNKFKVGRHV